MKKNFFKLALLFLGLLLGQFAYAETKYALIYNGPTTCEGCPEALAVVATKAKLPVKYVTNPNRIPALLSNAAILMIGGTDDNIEPMRLAFNHTIVQAIQNYLRDGGHYLGICGGAFIAARQYSPANNVWVKGFNIIPADAIDYSETAKPHFERVYWKKHWVTLYFQGGPTFIPVKEANPFDVIATYQNGEIAALMSRYGKGSVVVIGPHPEADKTWLEEDHLSSAHWQDTQYLLVDLIDEM